MHEFEALPGGHLSEKTVTRPLAFSTHKTTSQDQSAFPQDGEFEMQSLELPVIGESLRVARQSGKAVAENLRIRRTRPEALVAYW
jgi:hypothetical protein